MISASAGKVYPIADKNRVDRIIYGSIPQCGVSLTALAVVCQGDVSQDALQFSRRQFLDKGWIVDPPTVGGHRGKARHGDQFQTRAECSEKRLIQQELSAGPGDFFFDTQLLFLFGHDATAAS